MDIATLPCKTAPTRVNWLPCLTMTAVSLISYVDRSVLSILSPTILKDLHLNATQYGLAVSTFSICYMLSNPIWGFAIDRLGLFWSILVAVALWSLASGSHAFVFSLAGLCIARGMLGLGEGSTFPAGYTVVAETLPEGKRSFGIGLSYSGGALGAAITPLIVTPIAAAFGWRAAFLFTTGVGLLWIAVWVALRCLGLYVPQQRKKQSQGDVLSKHSDESERHPDSRLEKRAASGWKRILVATAFLYGMGALPLAFGLYSAPLFLARGLHQSQAALGHLLWIPPLGWELGYLVFGKLADKKKLPLESHPIALFGMLSIASLLIAIVPFVHSIGLTMILFFASMFFSAGFIVLPLTLGLRAVPRANSGLLAGLCAATWSVLVAILMPVVGGMFDAQSYTHAFSLVAVVPILGTITWIVLNPRRAGSAQTPTHIPELIR